MSDIVKRINHTLRFDPLPTGHLNQLRDARDEIEQLRKSIMFFANKDRCTTPCWCLVMGATHSDHCQDIRRLMQGANDREK